MRRLSGHDCRPGRRLRLSFDVTNTGQLTGQEIAQVYVSYSGSRVDRPVRDLKGFARVALAPGATQRVTIPVRARDLAFYDVDAAAWEVEAISYTVHVGLSSRDLPFEAPFSVTNLDQKIETTDGHR